MSGDIPARLPAGHTFYVVSVKKFALLFSVTMGSYVLVWFYEHWKHYRKKTGHKVQPAFRAIFWPIYLISFFIKVQKNLQSSGQACRWFPVLRCVLLFALIVLLLFGSLAAPDLAPLLGASLVTLALTGCVGFLLAGVQRVINLSECEPHAAPHSELTFANGIWVTIGSASWLLWLTGVYLLAIEAA